MDFKVVMQDLKFYNHSDVFQKDWELSQATYPGNDISFLKEAFLYEMNELLKLPDEVFTKLLDAVRNVSNNKALSRLVWHCHYVLFELADYPKEFLQKWPSLKSYDETVGDMFFAIIAISGIPRMQRIYKDLGIPKYYLIETLDYLNVWMNDFYKQNGRWGLSNFVWFRYYQLDGKLFRLGRLEFELNQFKGKIKVYRNIYDNRVIALSEAGVKFRSDGQVNGTNGIYDENGKWISELNKTNGIITGNPIHPLSYAINRKIRLLAKDWQLVLEKGNPILGIHIPATGELTPELTAESFNIAIEFYNKYFPDKSFKAFHCGTWFLDAQLQKLLSGNSNIVRFQENFYLYPTLTNDSAAFDWVFGSKPDDLSDLPRETQLHRAILSHYDNGGYLRTGFGFILVNGKTYGQQIFEELLIRKNGSCT